jgi:hypothetical protein
VWWSFAARRQRGLTLRLREGALATQKRRDQPRLREPEVDGAGGGLLDFEAPEGGGRLVRGGGLVRGDVRSDAGSAPVEGLVVAGLATWLPEEWLPEEWLAEGWLPEERGLEAE